MMTDKTQTVVPSTSYYTGSSTIQIANTYSFPPFSFNVGDECMLKIAKDGFYVRGKRVNQDDNEAEIVYNAFSQWLMLNTLKR